MNGWWTHTVWVRRGDRESRRALVLLIFGLLIAAALPAYAEEAGTLPSLGPQWGRLRGLSLVPNAAELRGPRASCQLVLTATFDSGRELDATGHAVWRAQPEGVVAVEDGRVRPLANGTAMVVAEVEGRTAQTRVTVTGMDANGPVRFHTEVLAALTKAGCNMGACHGSPSGKGGFRLSLRGYDPALDLMTLRREFHGRRVNVFEPDRSLVLRKPLMEIAHGGGKRMRKGDAVHRVLRAWIDQGMPVEPPETPRLERIEIFPQQRTLHDGADRQQLRVEGLFSDGHREDLTALTVFESSAESVGRVSADGLVRREGRGETAILARYLDKMTTAHITFLKDVEGFAWPNPPENNFVDHYVFQKLKQLQIPPSELCTDEEYLRRVYLDLAGRLPSIEETLRFLEDTSPTKRAELCDRLLESPDYAEFWALKWADVLRVKGAKLKTAGLYKFYQWLYESMLHDRPFDRMAFEMLTAQGSVLENPPAGYWRISRDPTDATETTAQLFLGIRIQCAKCHNHPFERWTQDNYYGIAAAFARVARKPGPLPEDEIIFAARSGEITQPRTGKTMKVHLLLKGDVDVPPDVDRRRVFAEWLTAPDNPFFARSVVNRIWGHLLGRGIVDPVDDFRDSNPPSNEELLAALTKAFVEGGFRHKPIIRTIVNSRVYQLSARTTPLNQDDEIYHSHAMTRLLAAEQLLDAICQVTGVPENFPGYPPGTRAVALVEPPKDHYFLKVFGQPQREMACQCERSNESNLSQALQMINGPLIHNKLRAENGRIARLLKEGKTDEQIVDELYLAAVCRHPAPAELQAALRHIKSSDDRRAAIEDVAWALLNSKEFLFQH
ncbi:MAG: DUF1553 domain-containing protein [Planctomycetota bacterium]|nr:MAG: DUF1553 domain-containing protein [Planctomycetota bacterium]